MNYDLYILSITHANSSLHIQILITVTLHLIATNLFEWEIKYFCIFTRHCIFTKTVQNFSIFIIYELYSMLAKCSIIYDQMYFLGAIFSMGWHKPEEDVWCQRRMVMGYHQYGWDSQLHWEWCSQHFLTKVCLLSPVTGLQDVNWMLWVNLCLPNKQHWLKKQQQKQLHFVLPSAPKQMQWEKNP